MCHINVVVGFDLDFSVFRAFLSDACKRLFCLGWPFAARITHGGAESDVPTSYESTTAKNSGVNPSLRVVPVVREAHESAVSLTRLPSRLEHRVIDRII
jgi:hypothetical protein